MKKNKMMRIASVLLVAVLLSTSVISGTFAKYTSTSEGTDSARVAKWSFKVGEKDIATQDFEFDLFNTTTYTDANVDTDGNGSEVVIAPGTQGNATVTLTNNSEVNAKYTVAFTAVENGVPLQWSKNGTEWVNNISDLDISTNDAVAINMGNESDITIYWKWAFESDNVVNGDQSNDIDTDLGTADALAEVTFTATITVTNTGKVAGKEAVQLYVTAPEGGLDKPALELKAFAKTKELAPGESQTLTMNVCNYGLASFNEANSAWEAAAGTYQIHFAASVADIKATAQYKLKKAQNWKVNNVLAPAEPINEIKISRK